VSSEREPCDQPVADPQREYPIEYPIGCWSVASGARHTGETSARWRRSTRQAECRRAKNAIAQVTLLALRGETGDAEGPNRDPADACSSSISRVWVSTIERLVYAAIRWSPAPGRPIAARPS
jgi:hypothetical protein